MTDAPERTPLRYDIDDSDLRDVHMRAFELGGWIKYEDYVALEQELKDVKHRHRHHMERDEEVELLSASLDISESEDMRLTREVGRLRAAVRRIAHLSTDCAAGDDPESFYRGQVREAVGIAARALTKPEGE